MNQFSDHPNPYQSPDVIQAELVRPERAYQPPRPVKPWPPFFAILWLACGPFIALVILRYFYSLGWFTLRDDAVYFLFYAVTATTWIIAVIRVIVWLCRR